MFRHTTRRKLLKGMGTIGATLALGSRVAGASVAADRWICDMDADGMTMDGMGDVEVLMDLREEIGYCMVECAESEIPVDAPVDFDDVSFDLEKDKEEFSQEDLQTLLDAHENGGLPYAPDVDLELAEPQAAKDSGLNAADTVGDELYDLQWDKQSQRIGQVHRDATGDGARIGVIDDGVLGANPNSSASHPDLPNVREDLSFNFTFDGEGPGPLNDDHGTHVAGTAAAAANGTGVVGVAPDAEVVDLRVFSGPTASTFGIVAAIVLGSLPEDLGGSGCDVVNLSLGLPTLPVCTFIGLLVLIFFYPLYELGAEFALANDCLPVASAGNSATNLEDPTADGFCAPPLDFEVFGESGFFTLPASVDQYLTVGATGPIGFGWGTSPGRGGGRGKGSSKTEEVIPGFEIERTTQTELFPEEPAFYSNYGGNGEVNVTAGGGNVDIDAANEADEGNYFYDLVFNTGFVTDETEPQDERLDEYTPSYAWKAGTSFSAPQVTGLAALLKGANPDASAGEIRDVIESTAKQKPVGKSGQTTSPETFPNVLGGSDGAGVQDDDAFNGDTASNPGSNDDPLDSATIRGSGHIDIKAAVKEITKGP